MDGDWIAPGPPVRPIKYPMPTMRAITSLVLVLPFWSLASASTPDKAVPKPIYPVRHWPQDIVSVPCSPWAKDQFGAWQLLGTLAWTGGDIRVLSPSYQPISPEGAIVEKRCSGR
jgi:hypothetical protein